jgi:hypothetical protein
LPDDTLKVVARVPTRKTRAAAEPAVSPQRDFIRGYEEPTPERNATVCLNVCVDLMGARNMD